MAEIAPGHNELLFTNYSIEIELLVKVALDFWLIDVCCIVVVEASVN